MKKIIRRGAAATLAAVTLVTSAAVPVRAAAPRVQVDETMYVNLDYYGTATQINVVKGCTTNGLTEYTDYGTYDKVVNMTDDTAPEIGDGTVTWKLPEKNSRFYYQCTMPKNSVDLPWTFDVSYKLADQRHHIDTAVILRDRRLDVLCGRCCADQIRIFRIIFLHDRLDLIRALVRQLALALTLNVNKDSRIIFFM